MLRLLICRFMYYLFRMIIGLLDVWSHGYAFVSQSISVPMIISCWFRWLLSSPLLSIVNTVATNISNLSSGKIVEIESSKFRWGKKDISCHGSRHIFWSLTSSVEVVDFSPRKYNGFMSVGYFFFLHTVSKLLLFHVCNNFHNLVFIYRSPLSLSSMAF